MGFLPNEFNEANKKEIARRVRQEAKEKQYSTVNKHAKKVLNIIMPGVETPMSQLKEISLMVVANRRFVCIEHEKDFEIRLSGKNFFERNTSWWDFGKIAIVC
jgi:hypothetical protein